MPKVEIGAARWPHKRLAGLANLAAGNILEKTGAERVCYWIVVIRIGCNCFFNNTKKLDALAQPKIGNMVAIEDTELHAKPVCREVTIILLMERFGESRTERWE